MAKLESLFTHFSYTDFVFFGSLTQVNWPKLTNFKDSFIYKGNKRQSEWST